MAAPRRPMTIEALVGDLREVWASLDDLLDSLGDADWDAPTDCPGWTVKDTVSHIIGTELMLAGHPDPPVDLPDDLAHVRNDIGRANEGSILLRRNRPPAEVLAEFREVVGERERQLGALDQAAMDAESWTPAGTSTYGRFMQIRVFDQWIHEQDIREAVGRPGGLSGPAAVRTLAEVTNGLGFVVGKKAGATDGSSVRFVITGSEPAVIDVMVDGRAAVTDDLVGSPTVIITTDLGTFIRLIGGRCAARGPRAQDVVDIEGDLDLAQRVLDNMGYTI